MSDQDLIAAEALAETLRSRAVQDAALTGPAVLLPALALKIHIHDASFAAATNGRSASVTFDARARGAESNGICVLSTGFGETNVAAARDAAMQWCLGVYPALVASLTQVHACEVGQSQMVVSVDDTAEQYGWRVHLAPVIGRLYGKEDSTDEIGQLERDEVLQVLFDALHPFAAHRTLFWLECFAARYPDGHVDATCRLHNAHWPEGEQALLSWAARWPDTGACILTRRQFLLFEPLPPSSLPSDMAKVLAEHANKRSWWRRLFAGA